MGTHDQLYARFFDQSHESFRRECRRFADKEIQPQADAWEEAGTFPRELYQKAAQAGLLGVSMPPELGGGGGDVFHEIVATEALLHGGSTGVVVGLNSLSIALPPILNLGTAEQKRRLVPPVLSGKKIAALAITEPGTGSDVASLRTRATQDGDGYRLNGTKMFITSGTRADQVTVLARTSDHPHMGLTFFVVERGMAGFSVGRALRKTGWWASDTAELIFDDVYVPAENRLGEEGSGFIAMVQNFAGERLMLAANGCALAQISLDDAIRYARQRQAFGQPIGRFQVIRHKLAEMATQVASARSLTYLAAAQVQAGSPDMALVAMAKNHAASVAQSVCYEAVQIFGGMGYMRETRAERFSRDARLLPIGGGTQEIMNELISRSFSL